MSERLRGLIRHYVIPPVFDDEDKTRIASLLNTILLVLMAVAVTYSAIAPIVDPSPAIALTVNGVMVSLYLGLLRLIRLGRVELAALLLSSGVWVLVTLAAIAYGGVLTPGLFSYFSTILIAGLLLGRRAALGFVGLSILGSLGLLYADLRQILPSPFFPTTPFTMWWMAVMNFIMAGVLLNWTVRSLNQALDRARRNECDLAQSNRNLQREIAERKQAEEALRQSEEAARRFQEQLKALHAVSIELSRADSFDELCRRAVELGRSRLGFDRLGLWFLADDPRFMVGTYGTSESGQLRDERGKRLPLDSIGETFHALSGKLSLKFQEDAPY
jgi:PAS domain-containing protein